MKIIKTFTFIFFTFIYNYSFTQTIIANYTFTYKNILNDTLKDQSKIGLEKKINYHALSSVFYTLIHSEKKSIYKSFEDVSIFTDVNEPDMLFLNNYKLSDYTSVVYKDFSNRKSFQREYILNKRYVIHDDIYTYEWDLKNETRNINGINCNLALTTDAFGDQLQVWFTESIPISNGPANYHGLPGLIVEIESN